MRFPPQTLFVGSNQEIAFRTQHGSAYGRNVACKIIFKVCSGQNLTKAYSLLCRGTLPAPRWLSLAQFLKWKIRRTHAEGPRTTFPLETKGNVALHGTDA